MPTTLSTTTPQTALKNLARQFLEHLEIEKNRSNNTVQNYAFYLGRFVTWASRMSIVVPSAITQDSVREYRLYLNRLGGEEHPLKKNTQNYHLIALRSFLKYLAKRDITTLAPEKIELAKMPQRTVSFLDGDELAALLSAPLNSQNPQIIKLRDRAILELLFSTGLRVSELANLKRTNVNLEKDEFTVHGKGDKYRIVFLSVSARETIRAYLTHRTDALSPLFTRHDRASSATPEELEVFLTPRSIQRLVHKYAISVGITKEITPHTMRHSFATDLLMNGADIRSVQAMLGHASITTTQIYTHITNQQLREVHQAFHGRRRGK